MVSGFEGRCGDTGVYSQLDGSHHGVLSRQVASSVLHLNRIILSGVRVREQGNRAIGGVQAKGWWLGPGRRWQS